MYIMSEKRLKAEINTVTLPKEWIVAHQKRIDELAVPYPWDDPLANKSGLVLMYISNTLTEIMRLSAEKEPDIRLNCINPDYKEFTGHFNKLMKSLNLKKLDQEATTKQFWVLHAFAERYMKDPVPVCVWDNYMPDIRVLDTVAECYSWLYMYCLDKTKV